MQPRESTDVQDAGRPSAAGDCSFLTSGAARRRGQRLAENAQRQLSWGQGAGFAQQAVVQLGVPSTCEMGMAPALRLNNSNAMQK